YPRDLDRDAVGTVVGHRHRLRVPLGLVVHTAGTDGVDVAPVALGLWVDLRVAVDLGCRGKHEPRPLRLREPERVEGAEGADLQRMDRILEVVARRCGRCQME